MKLKRTQLLRVAFLASALLAFLLSTNPHNLSVGYLFVPVGLLSLVVYFATLLFLSAMPHSYSKRPRMLAAICGLTPAVCLLLKSMGQFSAKDALLLALLLVSATFYISVLRFGKVQQ